MASNSTVRKKKNTQTTKSAVRKKQNTQITNSAIRKKGSNQEKQEKGSWFEKGSFEDGFDWHDPITSIVGTAADVVVNLVQGVGNLGEGIFDLAMYGEAALDKAFGLEERAEEMKRKAQKDAVNSFFDEYVSPNIDEYSFLGERTDNVAQGIGYTAGLVVLGMAGGAAGLGSVGTTALTTGTSFASATGSGVSEAYNAGASDADAWKYGLMSGGIEAGTEFMFGGLGKGANAVGLAKSAFGLDDMAARALTKNVKSQITKSLVQAGIKATGEGVEELAAGYLSAHAKKATYARAVDFDQLKADENLLESFISGMIAGGVFQGADVVKAVRSNTDMITGYTQREQSVIDAVYAELETEKTKNGEKLSGKDKAKLYSEVENMVERGEVSLESIEKALGGAAYTELDTLMKEAKEYQKLANTAEEKLTLNEQKRRDELDAKNTEQSYDERIAISQKALSKRVLGDLETDRGKGGASVLMRSYQQDYMKSQDFKAVSNDYKGAGKTTIENAEKAGFLNNTRKTHDLVNFAARMAEDTGTVVNFADNENLKKLGYTKEGATVNGVITPEGVILNINSQKALNAVLGHEIVHMFDKSPNYDKLKDVAFKHATTKGELESRRKALAELYKSEDIDAELVADLVGDYLFTDEKFVQQLAIEDRNLFQKIFDAIKRFLRLATKGSREARELQKMKDVFEKIYREGANTKADAGTGVKYSLKGVNNIEVVDGVAVASNVAEVVKSEEYQKPEDYMTKFSLSTTKNWETSYLSKNDGDEHLSVVQAINDFTDKMVQDDVIKGYVPTGNYKYTKMGPLRSNVEYIVTFDMDTSCPRTFQFLNFRNEIQRRAGRYLTYNESINLLELMRAYGQQIPCCYCYVENKRVLLSASYNNFFKFRNAVLSANSYEDAVKQMYGYSDKKGLPDASRKALERWMADKEYNPSLTEVWTASNTARNSVLNYLDEQLRLGNINSKTPLSKLGKMVREKFNINNRSAAAEIRSFINDWNYDTLANVPHVYNTNNDTSVSVVDEKALALNHEALAYSKSASSAKNVENFVPYTDQLKNVSAKDREYILGMGGIRKHSSNDFRMDYVQDYFLFYADLAAGKWTGHTYTKSADFVKIFACTNDRINMSVAFYEDTNGKLRENIDEGASWRDVKELRNAYKNVGSMAMVTSDNQLSYALNADWIDMIIPFHASGLDKSVWYNLRMWNDYTTKQSERYLNADDMKKKLATEGVAIPNGANAEQIGAIFDKTFKIQKIVGKDGSRVKPHFFPGDTYVNGQLVPGHHNNVETYFKLCEEYGVHPRFYGIKVTDKNGNQIDVTEHESYLKLIKETSRTDSAQEEIKFNFGNYDEHLKMTPFEYALQRLSEEAKNGGFENTKADPYGVVDEFMREYVGKDRPLGYLTERAKQTREMLLEMSNESTEKQSKIVEDEVNLLPENYKLSLTKDGEKPIAPVGDFNVRGEDIAKIAPISTDSIPSADEVIEAMSNSITEEQKLYEDELKELRERLDNVKKERDEKLAFYDSQIAKKTAEYESKKNKDTKTAENLQKSIERYKRLKGDKTEYYDNLTSSIQRDIGDTEAELEELKKVANLTHEAVGAQGAGGLKENLKESLENAKQLYRYFTELFVDKGMVFETIGKKHFNRALEAKWNQTRLSEQMAQRFISNGIEGVDSILDVLKKVNEMNASNEFEAYMYHLLNVDRMSLERGAMAKALKVRGEDTELAKLIKHMEAQNPDLIPAEAEIMKPGAKVVVRAQNQPGEIVSYNKSTGKYTVSVRSKNGHKKNVSHEAANLKKVSQSEDGKHDLGITYGDVLSYLRELEESKKQASPESLVKQTESIARGTRVKAHDRGNYGTVVSYDPATDKYIVNFKSHEGTQANIPLAESEFTVISQKKAKESTSKLTADGIKARQKHASELYNSYKWYVSLLNADDKPVFGKSISAQKSEEIASLLLAENPEFKEYAEAIYANMKALRQKMVDSGIITQQTADLWDEIYPHYVPIKRDKNTGAAINVPLDTNKTGVNAPIKGATGGNSDIGYLFSTLAERVEQTIRAVNRNEFGKELRRVLALEGVEAITESVEVAENQSGMDSVDKEEGVDVKKEPDGKYSFTVFENGERVTFNVTEAMYNALKPKNAALQTKVPILSHVSSWQRNVLTQYNPVFWFTNFFKDAQDVLWNSQHFVSTYKVMLELVGQAAGKKITGEHKYQKYIEEYMEHGGESVTFFDGRKKSFDMKTLEKKTGAAWVVGKIADINEAVERLPRLAEYIASREAGRSIEVSMLDASRVTTNFQAGGDITKWLNRNGFTFLNASVQGFAQNVRNVREAFNAKDSKGIAKGILGLALKVVILGLPLNLIMSLFWKDDEDYEQLSDYVKDNYYIVGKTDDGTFFRIPKGRMAAIVGDLFEQIGNLVDEDEADFGNTLKLAVENSAPNNPITNNVFAPIFQAAKNKAWHGGEIVPKRLQDLPAEEQYDESTDIFSKALGSIFNISPMKINYLLDQYTGGIGDLMLPIHTPESNTKSPWFIAPLADKFSTNANFNSQYVTDFYDIKDELVKKANSSRATDEDILKYKYFTSISSQIAELNEEKRKIQALPSDEMNKKEKYDVVYDIQEQINELSKKALDSYESVSIDGKYAIVGGKDFYWYEPGEDAEDAEPGWRSVTEKQTIRADKVCGELGLTKTQYWNNRDEYNYAYDSPERYTVAKTIGYTTYREHMKVINKLKSDKDANGDSIAGSLKKKVIAYIRSTNLSNGEKVLLYRSLYSDKTYNRYVIEYLNSRTDMSYEEKLMLLEVLGFKVLKNGRISW